MEAKKSNKKDERIRNWSFLVYPTKPQLDKLKSDYDGSSGYGTAPDNWREIVDEWHVQWVESPIHDRDENPDGTTKKPHWHVLIMFDGKKSFEQVLEITQKLNAPIPQKCHSTTGLVRYMAHLDHADKVQYSVSNIVGHGGVDVAALTKPTSATRYAIIAEMRQWVRESECTEFSDLFDFAAEEHFDDWFPLLCDNSAYIMGEYIRSRRGQKNEKSEIKKLKKIDLETGEILE